MKTRITLLALAALLQLTSVSVAQAADLPFNLLNGTWGGAGNLIYTSGPPDKLTCLGYYRSADEGKSLGIALRCTGQPDKIEFRSKLSYTDGKLSGTWEERTNNATGTASGTITGNTLRVDFGGSLSGSVAIAFSSSQQSVNITISTAGSELKGAKVSLNRR